MAEVTALRNNALPYPVYGVPYGVTFPILDADGDLVTGAASLDSERSLNGDTFADCTNEATEIATNSGMYYLLLTAAEMTADVVSVIVKTGTAGAKTTALTLYPRKLVPLRTGTSQGGDTGYITLDASAGALNDLWNGCLCVAVIDAVTEARIIDDYNGSNQQASVTPDWNTAPDSDDTFTIYLPEGVQHPWANVRAVSDDATAADNLESACDGGTYNLGGGAVVGASVTGAVGSVTGAVGSVTGDVGGKVLGGGAGSITGVGVRAADGSGNAIAPAATALSNATWTDARGGYLDKLNVSGTLAHSDAASTYKADVSALATLANQSTILANQATIAGYLDTEIAAILAAVDTEVAAIKAVTDKLDTALVQDGDVYDFTEAALAAAPSGGLSAAEIRAAVGLASANLDTQLGTIVADTDELQGDWADGGRLEVILDGIAGGGSIYNLTVEDREITVE